MRRIPVLSVVNSGSQGISQKYDRSVVVGSSWNTDEHAVDGHVRRASWGQVAVGGALSSCLAWRIIVNMGVLMIRLRVSRCVD